MSENPDMGHPNCAAMSEMRGSFDFALRASLRMTAFSCPVEMTFVG
jgi:hypothetical protein